MKIYIIKSEKLEILYKTIFCNLSSKRKRNFFKNNVIKLNIEKRCYRGYARESEENPLYLDFANDVGKNGKKLSYKLLTFFILWRDQAKKENTKKVRTFPLLLPTETRPVSSQKYSDIIIFKVFIEIFALLAERSLQFWAFLADKLAWECWAAIILAG